MTLAETAYQEIRRDIVRGVLRPGQALRMAPLSERYHMGFSPLREALTRLQSERLVVSVAMRGFTVAPLSMEEMWDAMQTRVHIETEALRLSIRHGDDAWEAGIVAAHHALKLQAERVTRPNAPRLSMMEIRHHAFHSALIAACRSKWLLDFSQKLYAETERYRYPALIAGRGEGTRDIPGEHERLMAATLARDSRLACRLLRTHLESTAQSLQGLMDEARENAESDEPAKV